ncbi:hypothetical protein F383_01968 [Gossypium arboreum]|uniref:Uncharacterized protein n=1 Tax=Gossypium arboreum TaxID=29729 RepID=A0A0B0PAG8_GOSAR|nr:hypothetical protein F383_01968 [Gossypium arboreum]
MRRVKVVVIVDDWFWKRFNFNP